VPLYNEKFKSYKNNKNNKTKTKQKKEKIRRGGRATSIWPKGVAQLPIMADLRMDEPPSEIIRPPPNGHMKVVKAISFKWSKHFQKL
jgi:hypothetical protein